MDLFIEKKDVLMNDFEDIDNLFNEYRDVNSVEVEAHVSDFGDRYYSLRSDTKISYASVCRALSVINKLKDNGIKVEFVGSIAEKEVINWQSR